MFWSRFQRKQLGCYSNWDIQGAKIVEVVIQSQIETKNHILATKAPLF
jgi:hypothetical protein